MQNVCCFCLKIGTVVRSQTHTRTRALEMNDCLVNAAAAQANIAEAPSLTSNTQQAINAKRDTYWRLQLRILIKAQKLNRHCESFSAWQWATVAV